MDRAEPTRGSLPTAGSLVVSPVRGGAVPATAGANGATEIACDTAEGATHWISLYERKGFRVIGRAAFEDTNYQSVILVKKL